MIRLSRRLQLSIGLVAVSALVAVGIAWWFFNGPGSIRGTYAKHESQYRQRIETLGRIGAKMDREPPVKVKELRTDLDPPLILWETCGIANEFDVRQPLHMPSGDPRVAVLPRSELVQICKEYQFDEIDHHSWKGPAKLQVRDRFEDGLKEIYLLIVRQVAYSRLEGKARLEGFIYDLRSEECIGRIYINLELATGITLKPVQVYQVEPGESERQAAERIHLGYGADDAFHEEFKRLTRGDGN